MFALGVQETLILGGFVIFILVSTAFWIWSLVDILKSNFTGNNKIIWLLVVFFLFALGSLLYLLIGRKQKVKP